MTTLSKLTVNELILILILILNSFMVDLSSDIFSPAIPLIQQEFHTSVFFAESLIGFNIIWLGASAVFYGILSDFHGRKCSALVGLTLFILGIVICIKAKNIFYFILGRNLQGMGSGFALAIGLATFRDLFQGKDFVKVTSFAGAILLFVPIVAPLLGTLLIQYYNWRATFYLILIMAVISLIFTIRFFKETNLSRSKPGVMPLFKNFIQLMRNSTYMSYVLVNSCITGGIWLLINFMPYILQIQFHKSISDYGVSLAIALLSGVLGALSNTKLINYFTGDGLLFFAISIAFTGAFAIFFSNFLPYGSLISLIGLSLYFFASAFIFPITSDLALAQVDDGIIGFASSVLTMIEMFFSGMILLTVGYLSNILVPYTSLVGIVIIASLTIGYGFLRFSNRK
jgi:DHA1 family bicyclomycin/chloramphenicol resistance-like MFS transporter